MLFFAHLAFVCLLAHFSAKLVAQYWRKRPKLGLFSVQNGNTQFRVRFTIQPRTLHYVLSVVRIVRLWSVLGTFSYVIPAARCSYPLEVIFPGPNLKVILCYAQVHLGISNHGETLLGVYQMATILHSDVLKRELLLVHCGGRQ